MYILKKPKTEVIISIAMLLGLVIGICISFLFFPKKETLICNNNYECKFERKYYGFIKSIKIFKVSQKTWYVPDSKIHFKLKNIRWGLMTGDGVEYYHVYSDNGKVNIKFKCYTHLPSISTIETTETNERNRFEKYKENPEYYSVTSSLSYYDRITDIGRKSLFSIIISLLVLIPLFAIITNKS